MTLFARLRSLLAGLLRRTSMEDSMQDEIRFHIDAYAADLVRSGVAPGEARRRARVEFGGVERVRDECRQARGLRWFDDLRGDLRYAARMLARNPGFTCVAVLSLALGIGANTAIFSLVNAVLLKTLPVSHPERLFFVDNTGGKSRGANAPPYPCYERLRDHNRYFSGIAAFDAVRLKVTIDGVQEQISGQYASGDYFPVLGLRPAYGRLLTPSDDSVPGRGGQEGASAVISYGFWERRFGKSPGVLGKKIRLGTTADWVTIVGVTPPEFFGLTVGQPVDLTIPMALTGKQLADKHSWWFTAVGRLKDGAKPEPARADLDAMFQQFMAEIGLRKEKFGENDFTNQYFNRIELVPAALGLDELRHNFSKPLLIVMTIVGLVLVIGCANVANLLLARATARRSEIAVRLAIGAGRGRLVRQMLTEGAVVTGLGAGLGILFARWGAALLVSFLAGVRQRIVLDPHLDARTLAFTAGLAVLTGILLSLAPALRATRPATPGSRVTMDRSGLRTGRMLVVTQVTLSLVLLSGAALFVRTLHNLMTLDAGFTRDGVLTMRVDPAEEMNSDRLIPAWRDLVQRLSAIPGVKSAAASTLSPLSGRDRGVRLSVAGVPLGREEDHDIHLNHVMPGYFETLGIAMEKGRAFTSADRANSARVAVLNQTAARFYFGGEDPLGKRITFGNQRTPGPYEIVGVARDTRYEQLRVAAERMVYLPVEQPLDRLHSLTLIVRSSPDPRGLAGMVRREIAQEMPGSFVTDVVTVAQQVDDSLVQERLVSMLASFFGILALLLAAIGLYGVMAYSVAARTREIGIRIAVGAPQGSVLWLVLRETLGMIACGVVLGVPAVLVLARLVKSVLYGLTPEDPLAISAAVVILMCGAAMAAYLPARRASRVDPIVALRYE